MHYNKQQCSRVSVDNDQLECFYFLHWRHWKSHQGAIFESRTTSQHSENSIMLINHLHDDEMKIIGKFFLGAIQDDNQVLFDYVKFGSS